VSEPAVVATEAGIRIASVRDVSDALGACFGSAGLLLTEVDLDPAVFDLRTGILGELMQKFVNYRMRLALVVPDPARHGERFVELAREHRTHAVVRMLSTVAEARAWLEGTN
jgi:hypothetical protein